MVLTIVIVYFIGVLFSLYEIAKSNITITPETKSLVISLVMLSWVFYIWKKATQG